MFCWGDNSVGQLGDGTTTRRRAPVEVVGVGDALAVAVGDSATCVVRASGKVVCAGQPGAGASCAGESPCATMTEIVGVERAVRVSVGKRHACAVDAGGGVLCWGDGSDGQLTGAAGGVASAAVVPGVRDAIDVVAGGRATCALRRGGEVVCWGQQGRGRLGDGATTDGVSAPRAVPGLRDARALSGAGPRMCATRADGTVACWGGLHEQSWSDREVTALTHVASVSDARRASVHGAEGCVVRAGGGVACWSSDAPVAELPGLSGVTEVAVGARFACAATSAGAISCWGDNHDGTLGNGDPTWFAAPVDVDGVADAVEVVALEHGTCARRSTGKVVCWGSARADAAAPDEVEGLDGATRLFGGFDRVCATRAAGAPACFGAPRPADGRPRVARELGFTADLLAPRGIPSLAASKGRLSFFDRGADRARPSPATGISGITALDATYATACVATKGADVACFDWDQGAFEAGAAKGTTFAVRPRRVAGTRDAVDVGMYRTACAALSSGKIACFDPAKGAATTMPDVDDAVRVSVASTARCALHRSGRVSCWGSFGSSHDGVFHGSGPVDGVDDAVSVGVASYHACVATRSGKVRCWGSNLGGRIGRRELWRSDAPVSVGLPR
ncbi:MAG: hypothetical protein IT374_11875 [Polyangiaceae bacterium]|nr:hypothetical protein [Polyangiaceae bacterium]